MSEMTWRFLDLLGFAGANRCTHEGEVPLVGMEGRKT